MLRVLFALIICLFIPPTIGRCQTLEQRLQGEPIAQLETDVLASGDAKRGAILFHRVNVGCAKCHQAITDSKTTLSLGPVLWKSQPEETRNSARYLIESILKPSQVIHPEFKSATVILNSGVVKVGLQKTIEDGVEIIDASTGKVARLKSDDIVDITENDTSIMPAAVVNTLASRQQFLDLARYVIEIRQHGSNRARELQPPESLVAFQVPAYEANVDHAGLLNALDRDAYQRGQQIYERLCINCHGTLEQPGSLPTALRFGQGKFKNGSDPYAMYQTLTHGFGLMVPQTWMVPQQKYDVIHYVRETFLKPHNPTQYQTVDERYLAALPAGETFGPEPTEFAPWRDMNYGPWMFNTLEVGRDGSNIAYKGIAVRLDPGPGGVSRGNRWMLFDHDTMRVAAAWSHVEGETTRFIDWNGIHFDGRHQAHPHVVGAVQFTNPTGPGWANPDTGSFEDDQRILGRDGKRYGPLPREWAKYKGASHLGSDLIVSYSVGDMQVEESFDSMTAENLRSADDKQSLPDLFARKLILQPTQQRHTLLLATTDIEGELKHLDSGTILLSNPAEEPKKHSSATNVRSLLSTGNFDGGQWLEVEDAAPFDMARRDLTIAARVKTREDGVIFCQTTPGEKWVPDGTVLFIRDGRLCYDIGWVGVVRSNQRIDDGRWHHIAMTWTAKTHEVKLFVDGKPTARGELAPKKRLKQSVVRVGYGAPNFPQTTKFKGLLKDIRFWQRNCAEQEIADNKYGDVQLVACWLNENNTVGPVPVVRSSETASSSKPNALLCGMTGDTAGMEFERRGQRLCLTIPPSDEVRKISVWLGSSHNDSLKPTVEALDTIRGSLRDNTEPQPAQPLWPEIIITTVQRGVETQAGFAIDVLTPPANNPWFARLRFSGLDFFADGDRMAACTWDGDVYEISGLSALDSQESAELQWRRIASGLFQPLGLKIVAGEIYLTCRDQLVILRDRNHDGATDFYECFNNDHQVTEHFHEFAMGLQRDAAGNFYYAKSARHAKTALVPHHGTLLQVSPDGERTTILATGFRAANGVCLNPDGSFIVTDQEGHWNPKNRINWVTKGRFYGNMYGYHDVTDESDDAMIPPLCWITNSFDRSPSELLWVDSPQWGNLNGTLLNLSYGFGKVYTVPHETVSGSDLRQGAMCQLPIPQFPTGTMRGRFHPRDGQLYLCGLFAWGSSQQQREGGLFRIRYTGAGAAVPLTTKAETRKLTVSFSDPIARETIADTKNFAFTTWDLKRTKNYGSKHYNEQQLEISQASLSPDGKQLTLTIPELSPTWCYELKCRLTTKDGDIVERVLHGTIHNLND